MKLRTDYDLVVVGSGIMGLSCAYEIAKKNFLQKDPLKILCLDEGDPFLVRNHFPSTEVTQHTLVSKKWATEFFHPSASFNAAGILATNGATDFRSKLRECLVGSIRMFPQWIDEMVGGSSGVELIPVDDYHLYDMDDPVQKRRFHALIERLKYERSDDGTVLTSPPQWLKKIILEADRFKLVRFERNHLVKVQSLLRTLVSVNQKLGVDFLWNCSVTKMTFKRGSWSIESRSRDQTDHPPSQIGAVRLILTTGWKSNWLDWGDLNWKKSRLNLKDDPGMIRGFRSWSALPINTIVRPGGRNYWINLSQGFLCYQEEDILDLGRMNFFLDQSAQVELRFGLRSISRDRRPLVGFLEPERNLGLATGHHKMGIGLAPLTARFMASKMFPDLRLKGEGSEKIPDLLGLMESFSPDRFFSRLN